MVQIPPEHLHLTGWTFGHWPICPPLPRQEGERPKPMHTTWFTCLLCADFCWDSSWHTLSAKEPGSLHVTPYTHRATPRMWVVGCVFPLIHSPPWKGAVFSCKWQSALCLLAKSLSVWLCDPMDWSPPGSLCPWGFSRQEYWRGLPCPPPGDLPNPGMEPSSLMSPALAGRFFTISATWEPLGDLVLRRLKRNRPAQHFLW